jgi:glucose/arabinose dehydrogenase
MKVVSAFGILGGMAVCAFGQVVPSGFVDSLVRGGWDQAVGVVFAPDGRAFIWEKSGRVWMMEGGALHDHPVIDISDEVRNFRDFGLLGFALDPDFLNNGRVYLSYIVDFHHLQYFGTPQYNPAANDYSRDSIGRITRYQLDVTDNFQEVVAGSRFVLVGETATTGIAITHQSHSMGSLVFGEDGSLTIAAGDGASYDNVDTGGFRTGSSNTALADGILAPFEDVGAFRSQLVNSHNGKILRIDPETGDGLPDNPFYDSVDPRGPGSRVWALGLRNPFRMTLRPGTGVNGPGTLYVGDVGWLDVEELNVAREPGMNFGWPLFEGFGPNSLYQVSAQVNSLAINPLAGGACGPFVPFRNLLIQETSGIPRWPNPCNTQVELPESLYRFEHARPAIDWPRQSPFRCGSFSGDAAIAVNVGAPGSPVAGTGFVPNGTSSTGGAWYTGSAFPEVYRDSYYHADFVGGWIHQFRFDAQDRPTEVRAFATRLGAIVDVEYNPLDQSLYYIAFDQVGESQLRRISYGLNAPPIAFASPAVSFGPLPLTINFSSLGSADPEQGPLTYLWEFGDGQTSTLANPAHTFTGGSAPQRFDVKLTVTDNVGNRAVASTIVSGNNTPPSVTITSPVDGSTFSASTFTLPLRATVTDAEHDASQLHCRWQASIRHNTHSHAEPVIAQCAPDIEIDGGSHSGETFFWEFRLTVTDDAGLSTVARTAMYPQTFDCNGNGVPDDQDIQSGTSADCNGDSIPDECTILLGLSQDCNQNLIPDECEAGEVTFLPLGGGPGPVGLNGSAGWVDGRIALTSPNTQNTGTALFSLGDSPVHGVDVESDVTLIGSSGEGLCLAILDASQHQPFSLFGAVGAGYGTLNVRLVPRSGGAPDEVQVIHNQTPIAQGAIPFELVDGQPHRLRVSVQPAGAAVWLTSAAGTPTQVVPRTLIPGWRVIPRRVAWGASTGDLATEHVIDNLKIFVAGAGDHNADMVPDACQDPMLFDCDGDGVEDWAAIAQGLVADCNGNLRPDSCDLALGASTDLDFNGVPDECDPCLGDYNGDEGVDGDDVIAFFTDWDAGLPGADVDNSGGVDGDDVILFFARWDVGC